MTKRLAAVALSAVLTACGGADEAQDVTRPQASGLQTKTIEAGEVTAKIEPVRIDDEGAEFQITLDTHSVELDMDLEAALLEVDEKEWTGARWKGSGPSGHHREGTLTFDAAGEAKGIATLTLDGFPDPVEASWNLAG